MSIQQQTRVSQPRSRIETKPDSPVIGKLAIAGVCIVAALSICANVLLFYRWSDRRPVVTFDNNRSISKIAYLDALDSKDQGAVLKQLVYRAIVSDAAAKAGLTPTSKEIDDRLAQVQRESPQLLQGDGTNPTDVAENRADMAAAVALDKLRFRGIACSDAEARAFYAQHQALFLLPRQSMAVLVVAKNPVDSATAERLLRTGARPDAIAQAPGLLVSGLNGFTINMQALPPTTAQQIEQTVYSMPVGSVKTFAMGQYYLSVRLEGRNAARVPTLAEVRDQVVRDVMNQKAPSVPDELALIYQAAHVQFSVEKYAPYFDDVRTFNTNGSPKGQTSASP